jgi:type III pantothenate kinase
VNPKLSDCDITSSLCIVPDTLMVDSVGYSVQDAVQAGVVSGILFEIQGSLSRFPEKTPVFTGGDALYFAKKMKNPIFVVCNLVLTGLALIAEDYVQRKD